MQYSAAVLSSSSERNDQIYYSSFLEADILTSQAKDKGLLVSSVCDNA